MVLEAEVVAALLDQGVAFPVEPERFVLLEARIAGQAESAIKGFQRRIDLSEPEVAQSQIAQILAHGRLESETLADVQGPLIVAESLPIASEQQVNSTKVAQSVAFSTRKFRIAI